MLHKVVRKTGRNFTGRTSTISKGNKTILCYMSWLKIKFVAYDDKNVKL